MTDPYAEAIHRFQALLARATRGECPDPTAMILATADREGRPSSRAILLKVVDERGFVFYTSTRSRKGGQLAENPWVSLTFFWPTLREQVNVEGRVEPVSPSEADDYWLTRPRESQIGGWASLQSEPLAERADLVARFDALGQEHAGRDVPRPEHWSGYRVLPHRIEFWRAGEHRLHHRLCYELGPSGWRATLLYP